MATIKAKTVRKQYIHIGIYYVKSFYHENSKHSSNAVAVASFLLPYSAKFS